MVISTNIIVPLFLVAFIMLTWQSYMASPDRRVLNVRFLLLAGALGLIFTYVLASGLHTPVYSTLFLVLGVAWNVCALLLLKRLPARKKH